MLSMPLLVVGASAHIGGPRAVQLIALIALVDQTVLVIAAVPWLLCAYAATLAATKMSKAHARWRVSLVLIAQYAYVLGSARGITLSSSIKNVLVQTCIVSVLALVGYFSLKDGQLVDA